MRYKQACNDVRLKSDTNIISIDSLAVCSAFGSGERVVEIADKMNASDNVCRVYWRSVSKSFLFVYRSIRRLSAQLVAECVGYLMSDLALCWWHFF